MTHAMQEIAETGSKPFPKVEKLRTHNMDKSEGWTWAQTCIALCMTQGSEWTAKARELFTMTIEQRDAVIKTWRDWKSAETKAFKAEQHTEAEQKLHKRTMGTMTVRLSHLATISKAVTAGMDMGTLATFFKADPTTLSIDQMYELAKTYSTAKAGRTPDNFLTKLGKFLEAYAKNITPDTDAGEIEQYNKVVTLHNTLGA